VVAIAMMVVLAVVMMVTGGDDDGGSDCCVGGGEVGGGRGFGVTLVCRMKTANVEALAILKEWMTMNHEKASEVVRNGIR
jgi:hypothetical protein